MGSHQYRGKAYSVSQGSAETFQSPPLKNRLFVQLLSQ